jgi:hypothetical protein
MYTSFIENCMKEAEYDLKIQKLEKCWDYYVKLSKEAYKIISQQLPYSYQKNLLKIIRKELL